MEVEYFSIFLICIAYTVTKIDFGEPIWKEKAFGNTSFLLGQIYAGTVNWGWVKTMSFLRCLGRELAISSMVKKIMIVFCEDNALKSLARFGSPPCNSGQIFGMAAMERQMLTEEGR